MLAIMATGRLEKVDRLRRQFATAGHAWTRPRAAVLHVLVATVTPIKVEEIHARSASGRPAGASTWPRCTGQ